MNKRLLTTILGLVLLCALTFSQNFAPSEEKSEKQKKKFHPLMGLFMPVTSTTDQVITGRWL